MEFPQPRELVLSLPFLAIESSTGWMACALREESFFYAPFILAGYAGVLELHLMAAKPRPSVTHAKRTSQAATVKAIEARSARDADTIEQLPEDELSAMVLRAC